MNETGEETDNSIVPNIAEAVKYLRIRSKGEMASEALSLIGASTKRGDGSSIGMFGSGNKYAIAAMMRQKVQFLIFGGLKQFKITTRQKTFGDKIFNQIFINGAETSLTDSMGTEDWEGAWPYIREIYSNALDEGEASVKIVETEDLIPEEGFTTYFIKINNDSMEVINNFENYFVNKSKHLYADTDNNYIHTATTEGVRIYRKGIIVHSEKHDKSMFHYDLDKVGINESRILNSVWGAKRKIGVMFERCTDKSIINQLMAGLAGSNNGFFEYDCILPSYEGSNASPEFISYCANGKFYPVEIEFMLDGDDKQGRLSLPLAMLKRMLKACKTCDILGLTTDSSEVDGKMFILEKNPSDALKAKVEEATEILKATSYNSRLKYPIKLCKFRGDKILGLYKKENCYLSIKLEMYPVEEVAAIIMEEMEHGHSGHDDESRAFQNHLFKLALRAYRSGGDIKGVTAERDKYKEQIDEYAHLNPVSRLFTKIK
jgi:hypothetical protein